MSPKDTLHQAMLPGYVIVSVLPASAVHALDQRLREIATPTPKTERIRKSSSSK